MHTDGRGFAEFRGRIGSPALATIADHWKAAMGNKRMPVWTAIQPSWIAPHLTRVFAFTYDRQSGEITRRLMGGELLAMFAGSPRGTPLEQLQAQFLPLQQMSLVAPVCIPCVTRPAQLSGQMLAR